MVLLGMKETVILDIPGHPHGVLKSDFQLCGKHLFNPCNQDILDDCPKSIYPIALDFYSYSRRDIRRKVNYVIDVATQKTEKKTRKVVNSLREISL